MSTTWRIVNGRIIDPVNKIDRSGDLLIRDGVIVRGRTNRLPAEHPGN